MEIVQAYKTRIGVYATREEARRSGIADIIYKYGRLHMGIYPSEYQIASNWDKIVKEVSEL